MHACQRNSNVQQLPPRLPTAYRRFAHGLLLQRSTRSCAKSALHACTHVHASIHPQERCTKSAMCVTSRVNMYVRTTRRRASPVPWKKIMDSQKSRMKMDTCPRTRGWIQVRW